MAKQEPSGGRLHRGWFATIGQSPFLHFASNTIPASPILAEIQVKDRTIIAVRPPEA